MARLSSLPTSRRQFHREDLDMTRHAVPVVAALLAGCGGSAAIQGGLAPMHGLTRTQSHTFTPDFTHTRAVRITFNQLNGSFAIPKLNGLTGIVTYFNGARSVPGRIWTNWQAYGSPPSPSNGGIIVAYLALKVFAAPPQFGVANTNASITYSKLIAAKTYSMDVFDAASGSELNFYDIGSPSNGTLKFSSPLNNLSPKPNEVLYIELVQNP